MQRTRQEILSILRTKGEQTVRELAAALGLTQMSVRLHLAVLQRDDLVNAREVHQPVGRPSFSYRLTERADDLFPTGYGLLAERLLGVAEATCGDEVVEALYQGLIDDMERRYRSRLPGGRASLDDRVGALVDQLSDEGFMAEAEQTEDGYLVRACNCPYARLARSHPGLCRAECTFIERALCADDEDVVLDRTGFRLQGDLHCTYRVRRTGPASSERTAS